MSSNNQFQFITYPVELEMANLLGVKEIRSISKFGLSIVTIVSEGKMPLNSSTWMGLHPEVRFTIAQREQLVDWFNQNGGGANEENHQKEINNDDD